MLSRDDVEAWDTWMRTARVHSTTAAFRRRVDLAKRVAYDALDRSTSPQVAWSAGKDSTALAHLVIVGIGARDVELFSEKDDLDFPGEEDYVRTHAALWGATRLRIMHPPISALEFVRERGNLGMMIGDEIHSRSAPLSKACFYNVVREANAGRDCVMLGLRSDESAHRRALRAARGKLFRMANGVLRALPIADWTGLDVFAYLASVDVEPFPVYRCIGLMHRDDPWRLRKSWWLPGNAARFGQVAWLRRYYPSLYRQCCSLLDGTPTHA